MGGRCHDDILKGIVLAEIELTQPDQDLKIPDWVGAEVTDDPRYRKVNMRAERLANRRLQKRFGAPRRTAASGWALHLPGVGVVGGGRRGKGSRFRSFRAHATYSTVVTFRQDFLIAASSEARSRSACQRSTACCMSSQNAGPFPKSAPSRAAIAGVTPCRPRSTA